MDDIIKQLEDERNRIDRAIQVLAGIRSGTISNRAATKGFSPTGQKAVPAESGKRHISAAGRARIAAAARARWAKVRAGKK